MAVKQKHLVKKYVYV